MAYTDSKFSKKKEQPRKKRTGNGRPSGFTVSQFVDPEMGQRCDVNYNGTQMARYVGDHNVVYIRQSVLDGRHPFVTEEQIIQKLGPYYNVHTTIESLDG